MKGEITKTVPMLMLQMRKFPPRRFHKNMLKGKEYRNINCGERNSHRVLVITLYTTCTPSNQPAANTIMIRLHDHAKRLLCHVIIVLVDLKNNCCCCWGMFAAFFSWKLYLLKKSGLRYTPVHI